MLFFRCSLRHLFAANVSFTCVAKGRARTASHVSTIFVRAEKQILLNLASRLRQIDDRQQRINLSAFTFSRSSISLNECRRRKIQINTGYRFHHFRSVSLSFVGLARGVMQIMQLEIVHGAAVWGARSILFLSSSLFTMQNVCVRYLLCL